jgi:flagellar hook assembly protein FlgD
VPDQIEWQRVRVEIFDMTGRKIREFTPDEYNYNGFINIEWKGLGGKHAPADKGIYMVVVTGETFKKQMKILKIN